MFTESMVCNECGAAVVDHELTGWPYEPGDALHSQRWTRKSECARGCMGEHYLPVQMFAKIVHQGKRCRLDLSPSWLARVAGR